MSVESVILQQFVTRMVLKALTQKFPRTKNIANQTFEIYSKFDLLNGAIDVVRAENRYEALSEYSVIVISDKMSEKIVNRLFDYREAKILVERTRKGYRVQAPFTEEFVLAKSQYSFGPEYLDYFIDFNRYPYVRDLSRPKIYKERLFNSIVERVWQEGWEVGTAPNPLTPHPFYKHKGLALVAGWPYPRILHAFIAFGAEVDAFEEYWNVFPELAFSGWACGNPEAPVEERIYYDDQLPDGSRILKGSFLWDIRSREEVGSWEKWRQTSPLGYAARNGQFYNCELLLKLGADPNSRGYENAPLILAHRARRKEIVKLLLDFGANPYHKNEGDVLSFEEWMQKEKPKRGWFGF
jgi:hypothetical protein